MKHQNAREKERTANRAVKNITEKYKHSEKQQTPNEAWSTRLIRAVTGDVILAPQYCSYSGSQHTPMLGKRSQKNSTLPLRDTAEKFFTSLQIWCKMSCEKSECQDHPYIKSPHFYYLSPQFYCLSHFMML